MLPKTATEIVINEAEATESGAFLRQEDFRGVVRIEGRDTLDLLNRLTTMKVDTLTPGETGETLIVNEKGRVLDAVLVIPAEDGLVRLLTSSPDTSALIAWLEKYTIMEDCAYSDESKLFTQYSLYHLPENLQPFGLPELRSGQTASVRIGGAEILALRHESVTGSAVRLLCPEGNAEDVGRHLIEVQGIPRVGLHAWTLWRVAQQIPVLGHELSELANPLEAGAAAGVDFEKGCYIGQEVIARLDSYNKVQRRLARLTWQTPAPGDIPTGGELRSDGKNAGFVTTHVYDPRSECFRGLGLIRIVFAEQGTSLQFDQDGHEYSLKVDLD